jgi:hypothetical protein
MLSSLVIASWGSLYSPVMRLQTRRTPGSTAGTGASGRKAISPEVPYGLPLTVAPPEEQRFRAGKHQKNGEVGRVRHHP